MQAYNHFYNATGHATVQKEIFQLLRNAGKQKSQNATQKPAPQEISSSMPVERLQAKPRLDQEPDQQNAVYAFLIGTGGYRDDLIELLTAE